jgi:hypothetical protein
MAKIHLMVHADGEVFVTENDSIEGDQREFKGETDDNPIIDHLELSSDEANGVEALIAINMLGAQIAEPCALEALCTKVFRAGMQHAAQN